MIDVTYLIAAAYTGGWDSRKPGEYSMSEVRGFRNLELRTSNLELLIQEGRSTVNLAGFLPLPLDAVVCL